MAGERFDCGSCLQYDPTRHRTNALRTGLPIIVRRIHLTQHERARREPIIGPRPPRVRAAGAPRESGYVIRK
jgi:hypothetical protein